MRVITSSNTERRREMATTTAREVAYREDGGIESRSREPQCPHTQSLGSERMLHPPKAAENELADALARQLELRGDPVEGSLRPF
jgi:hypothetical protein